MSNLEVRITKGTKRLNEVYEVAGTEGILTCINPETASGSPLYIKKEFYVIYIDGFKTLLDKEECEIATKINILDFI